MNKYSHDDLVEMARKWLWKKCCIVVTEMSIAYGEGEIADAIGWDYCGWSIVIECKASRADFLKDRKKLSRTGIGMGDAKYYLTPKGIISTDELPNGWGLLEFINKKRLPKVIRQAVENKETHPKYGREISLLISCLRRIGGLRDGISVKCYQFHSKNRATLGIKKEKK